MEEEYSCERLEGAKTQNTLLPPFLYFEGRCVYVKLPFETSIQRARNDLVSVEMPVAAPTGADILRNVQKEIRQLEKEAVQDRAKARLNYEEDMDVFLDGKVAGLKEAREVIERYLNH